MTTPLSASAQRVQEAIAALGYDCRVVEMEQTTRSAADAAKAVGCDLGQIVKSLVFVGKTTGTPVVVLTSGANRVNTKQIAKLVSEPVTMAAPELVREKTGFAIGGVPPIGHLETMPMFMDQDLMQYETIWAAAGNPNAMFALTPHDLQTMTKARVISVT